MGQGSRQGCPRATPERHCHCEGDACSVRPTSICLRQDGSILDMHGEPDYENEECFELMNVSTWGGKGCSALRRN